MKKLLFLFDTDEMPSVFDTVVGYDGGADRSAFMTTRLRPLASLIPVERAR